MLALPPTHIAALGNMEFKPSCRKSAAVYLRCVETGGSKRGAPLSPELRRQYCERLLEYAQAITNETSKAKLLNRVRAVLENLKKTQLQQNVNSEVELNTRNLHTVHSMMGMLENLHDSLQVQQRLVDNNQAELAD